MVRKNDQVKLFSGAEAASKALAIEIRELIQERAAQGGHAVLGLATGHTPIDLYRELARMHRTDGLDLSNVITFNLDEYWPMAPECPQSYRHWMFENFFNHVNIAEKNIWIPDGTTPLEKIDGYCESYERAIQDAGGIDFQILGIGRNGHVGFNEPGCPSDSPTRLVTLDRMTRKDAAGDFLGEQNVPLQAITMGMGTITSARQIRLLAFGEDKAAIVRRAVEEPVSPRVPASILQVHPDAAFCLVPAAAARLTQVATPWLEGSCTWSKALTRKAVLWLSRKADKPILALTEEDYLENHLYGLLTERGGAEEVNLEVFRDLMETITGWPAGKEPGRTVLVFSPHPDDDVISMGATLSKMARHGHDVHVAYQTSGSIAVFDHVVRRQMDFVRDFNEIFRLATDQTERVGQSIDEFLRGKGPAGTDSPELQKIKTLIRRTEATAAAAQCRIPRGNLHFLDMPFYRTGTIRKLPIGERDVEITLTIINEIQPDLVFAAGDLSDPHSTHRMCLQAVVKALGKYRSADRPAPALWLYRGA